ncbi:MAG: O-antigen ligase family protein [Candidatus Komeilibacteria bacterium]
MIIKLLTNRIKEVFLGLIIFEALSFWLWYCPSWSNLLFLVIFLTTLIISYFSLEWGIYIILTELFIGSHGHAIDLYLGTYHLSLRIGLFVAVFVAMLYHLYQKRDLHLLAVVNKKWLSFFVIMLLIGIVQGLLRNGLSNTFFDVNGYLFLLLLPAFYLVFNPNFLINIFRLLLISVNWLTIKTYLLLFAFSHDLSWLDLSILYRWIRDQRFGEITHVSNNFYRIFMQSQLYGAVVIILILVVIYFWSKNNIRIKDQWYLYCSLLMSVALVLASFSRSYWIGLLVTFLIICFILLIKKYLNWKRLLITLGIFVLAILLSIVLLFTWTSSWYGGQLSSRALEMTESAVSSRQAQLIPLKNAILQRPNFGSGFGRAVTYQSTDPRIKNEQNPTGTYTTFAFEWGYLDIILKIGIFGLLAYLATIYTIYVKKANLSQNGAKIDPLKLGFAYSIILLCIVNVFSPYLNHPLGIGLLLINFYHES